MNKPSYEKRLKDALTYVLIGDKGGMEEHFFEWEEDGDGWNEPYSDSFKCGCEEWGMDWIQSDPKCSGRPDLIEMVLSWADHINNDYYAEMHKEWEALDNGDLSQDSDPL